MTKKQLLREFFQLCDGGFCQDLLTESDIKDIKDNNAFYVTGIAQRADAVNGNGRRYPYNILAREVEKYKQLIREGRSAGELNHPDDTIINPQNVSHKVVDIWWNGKDVMVKLKLLTTPMGEIFRKLIQEGVAMGLSSRALGSTREEGKTIIVEPDLDLICFDAVTTPSVQGAFMQPINNSNQTNGNSFNLNEIKQSDKLSKALLECLQ